MEVSKATIENAPELYLHSIDGDHFLLLPMERSDFERSIFLDHRIRNAPQSQVFRVPVDPVVEYYDGPAPARRPIGWIFHVAQCGSTLLARALDLPGRSLVLREPGALRQLGVSAGAGARRHGVLGDAKFARLLEVVTALTGKRWAGEGPVIVKGNVPMNFIAGSLMAQMPGTPAIALHFPLANYTASILRTVRHHEWLENVYTELRVEESEFVAIAPPRTVAERTAALWFAMMKQYETLLAEHSSAVSLDASTFFNRPVETILAAAAHFGVAFEREEADALLDSELFLSNAKNPALDYDREVRAAREVEAMARLAPEIAEAHAWAENARARHGLPEALARPLIGEPVALLG